MSSTTKPYEEKMSASVNHLVHELAAIRAGRANPAILDCGRGPHPDHHSLGPSDAQAHLQGPPDQRHRH